MPPVPGDPGGAAVRVEDGDGWSASRAWRLERDLVVGEVEGPLAFGRVADVAPRSAGGFWVVDALAARVRGFDAEGREVLALGGRGDGPGELRGPVGVVETDDGRLAVLEAFPPRISWFTPDGRPSGRTRPGMPEGGTGVAFAEWAVTADGTPFADLFAMPRAAGESEVRHILLRLAGPGRASSAADTLLTWTVAAPIPVPGGPIPVLPTRPSWTVASDGTVSWTPGTPYEVRVLSPDGRPVRILRRPVEAAAISPGLREHLAGEIRRSLADGGGGAAPDGFLERLSFPERLPHVARLWASRPDGALRVARYTASAVREGRPTAVDVFSADGGFLGEMPIPEGLAPRTFTPEAVYGVWTDDLGVSYAARYRIVRPGP